MKAIRVRDIMKGWLTAHPYANEDEYKLAATQIVRPWLKNNGYGGLAGYECGCGVNDFAPCESPSLECVAGHFDEKTGDYLPGKIPQRRKCPMSELAKKGQP